MKKIVVIILLLTSLSAYSQFYSEIGYGFAFPKQKKKFIFNSYNNFKIVGNLFTGHFYTVGFGYVFKNKIGVEAIGEFNPKSASIFKDPKSIVNEYYALNLYDGSFLSVIPRITYQYQLKDFYFLLGWGIGYHLLNHYSYLKSSYASKSYNSQNELVYSRIERKEILYRLQEDHFIMNAEFKTIYRLNSNISLLASVNVNFNSKFYVTYQTLHSKLHKKIYINEFDINSNPNTTITEIDEIIYTKPEIRYFEYYDYTNVYNRKPLLDLIYPQIGIRYTFSKKEVAKNDN